MKQLILIFFFLVCYASNEQASAQNFMYKERTTGAHASLSLTENGISLNVMGGILNFELKDPNYAKDIFLYQNPGEKNEVFMSKTNFSIILYLERASMLYTFDLSSSATPPNYMGGGNSGHIGSNSSTYRQTCSLCGGKGWIAGSKTPTYGNSGTHWCSECGKTVNASHSHDSCPSCGGKGYYNKIK